MNCAKNRIGGTGRPLLIIVMGQLLLLLFSSSAWAQVAPFKVTATPPSVKDATKPGPVVLHVTKSDGNPVDATFKDQLAGVKVGEADATQSKPFDPTKGEIEITPPANLTGAQKIRLVDKAGQTLAETPLEYPNASSAPSTASPAATPDGIEARRDKLMDSTWYYGIVTLLFAGLIIPFALTLVRVIRFSKSSFRNPLGFPDASFRAILAYTLVAYLGFYILTSLLSVSLFEPPQFLVGIVATVVGFYFGSRTTEEGTEDPTAGTVRGIVRVGPNPARGALVKFKRGDGTEPYSRITNLEGHFELHGAKAGKYKVTAVITGSPASEAQEVSVSEGSDQEIEIVIKPPA